MASSVHVSHSKRQIPHTSSIRPTKLQKKHTLLRVDRSSPKKTRVDRYRLQGSRDTIAAAACFSDPRDLSPSDSETRHVTTLISSTKILDKLRVSGDHCVADRTLFRLGLDTYITQNPLSWFYAAPYIDIDHIQSPFDPSFTQFAAIVSRSQKMIMPGREDLIKMGEEAKFRGTSPQVQEESRNFGDFAVTILPDVWCGWDKLEGCFPGHYEQWTRKATYLPNLGQAQHGSSATEQIYTCALDTLLWAALCSLAGVRQGDAELYADRLQLRYGFNKTTKTEAVHPRIHPLSWRFRQLIALDWEKLSIRERATARMGYVKSFIEQRGTEMTKNGFADIHDLIPFTFQNLRSFTFTFSNGSRCCNVPILHEIERRSWVDIGLPRYILRTYQKNKTETPQAASFEDVLRSTIVKGWGSEHNIRLCETEECSKSPSPALLILDRMPPSLIVRINPSPGRKIKYISFSKIFGSSKIMYNTTTRARMIEYVVEGVCLYNGLHFWYRYSANEGQDVFDFDDMRGEKGFSQHYSSWTSELEPEIDICVVFLRAKYPSFNTSV